MKLNMKTINQAATLTDKSRMPFGKYRGKEMLEVPVSYLHWLWHEGKRFDYGCPVYKYILLSMDSLKYENPDLIWEMDE